MPGWTSNHSSGRSIPTTQAELDIVVPDALIAERGSPDAPTASWA